MCDYTAPPAPDPSAPPRRRRHAGIRTRQSQAAGPAPGRLARLHGTPNGPGYGLHDPPGRVDSGAGGGGGGEEPRLPCGEGLSVRLIGPGDRAAALAMHERCSPDTIRRRYHGPVADADRYLGHLLDPRHGYTVAVEAAPGVLVALGHLLWDGEETEVALLVEDGWQRRGLGTLLLRRLVALAGEDGRGAVYAVTQGSDRAMAAAMRRLGLPLEERRADGTVVITATLTGTGNSAHAPGVSVPK